MAAKGHKHHPRESSEPLECQLNKLVEIKISKENDGIKVLPAIIKPVTETEVQSDILSTDNSVNAELGRKIVQLESSLENVLEQTSKKDEQIQDLLNQIKAKSARVSQLKKENEEITKSAIVKSKRSKNIEDLSLKLKIAKRALKAQQLHNKAEDFKAKKVVFEECLKRYTLLDFLKMKTFFNGSEKLQSQIVKYHSAALNLLNNFRYGHDCCTLLSNLGFADSDFDDLRNQQNKNLDIFRHKLIDKANQELFGATSLPNTLDMGLCILCLGLMYLDPTYTLESCGHAFHSACIKKWKKTRDCCPQCKPAFINKEDFPRLF